MCIRDRRRVVVVVVVVVVAVEVIVVMVVEVLLRAAASACWGSCLGLLRLGRPVDGNDSTADGKAATTLWICDPRRS